MSHSVVVSYKRYFLKSKASQCIASLNAKGLKFYMGRPYIKKRFIAGASCPACSQMDVVFTFEANKLKWRACALCDFEESIAELENNTHELPTRVNQHRLGEQPLAHETPVERVKLIDPRQKSE